MKENGYWLIQADVRCSSKSFALKSVRCFSSSHVASSFGHPVHLTRYFRRLRTCLPVRIYSTVYSSLSATGPGRRQIHPTYHVSLLEPWAWMVVWHSATSERVLSITNSTRMWISANHASSFRTMATGEVASNGLPSALESCMERLSASYYEHLGTATHHRSSSKQCQLLSTVRSRNC